jgi:dipeptidyl-peptidase 4
MAHFHLSYGGSAMSAFSRRLMAGVGGLLALSTLAFGAEPARRKLALSDLTAEPPVTGWGISAAAWIPGTDRFCFIRRAGPGENAASDLYSEDAKSGRSQRLVEGKTLIVPGEPTETPGKRAAGEKKKPRTIPLSGYVWSPDGRTLLLSGDDDLWLYDPAARKLDRLTHDGEEEEFPSFSPDGRRVAFVRKHNLYCLDLATRRETQLTRGGAEHIYNGRLDWVYEEELASRSGKSYEWAPDGQSIAYIRLDENRVPAYPLVDFLGFPHVGYEPQRYPNPGDPNSIPSVHVVDLGGAERASITFSPNDDLYVVPQLSWTRDSKKVAYQVLDRAQTHLEVRLLDVRSGGSSTLLQESDRFWINVSDFVSGPDRVASPYFLPDGRYLWLSERSGFRHFYLGRVGETGLQPITRGGWVVDRIVGVDEKGKWIYFTSTEKDVRERQIDRVRFDGSHFERLSTEAGTHSGDLSSDGRYILEGFSNLTSPPEHRLLRSDGRLVRTVDAPRGELDQIDLSQIDFVDVKADDGTILHGRLMRPSDFDPSRRYSVLVYVYGGPHVQIVRNVWRGISLFELLAEHGILVWSLDNRGSWGRGHAFETPIFENMGHQELEDQLAGVRYLKSLPYVDPGRIGIHGWSYGGYMTLYSLTNAPGVWKCGIAGAPVTDWRFYDSIYTERYMRTPKENPEGYEASAPLTHADRLKAKLFEIHGTSDDNVHMQNTLAFTSRLIKAGIPYELEIQPGQKHGFRGKAARDFLYRSMYEFLEKNL